MRVVRSCPVAATGGAVVLSLLAVCCRASVSAVTTCCVSPVDAHGNCTYGKRKYHAVETVGDGPCDNGTAAFVRKCCPPGQTYDTARRLCETAADAGVTVTAFRRAMQLNRLRSATVVGYTYTSPFCVADRVLVDVPADELGRLLRDADSVDARLVLLDRYCVDMASSTDELVGRTCRPRSQYCRDGRTCVNKCCGADQYIVNGKCKRSKIPFKISLYKIDETDNFVLSNNTPLPYHENIICDSTNILKDFKVVVNGSVYLPNRNAYLSNNEYCVDMNAETEDSIFELNVHVCSNDITYTPKTDQERPMAENQSGWKFYIILAGFMSSIVCLILTLFVYATLSSLRNVHGYYVMCYVACLLLLYIFLLIIQWEPSKLHELNLCILFGYLTLFTFLTTFCWLNIICFDLYWMLRYNNSATVNRPISIRTTLYNIYCWGFSSVWTLTAFLFQNSKYDSLQPFAPDIGTITCWFSDDNYGIFIFFMTPFSIMLIVNLILFVLTAIYCSRIKSELDRFRQTETKTKLFQLNKKKFVISIKLFLIMGITWSFEMINRFLPSEWFIWTILDVINSLQGVMIFIIFVAKRKVLRKLQKTIMGSIDHSESTKTNTTNESLQSINVHRTWNDF